MLRPIGELQQWGFGELETILTSPLAIYYHWRHLENGDLNYRRWVGGIFFPNNPCAIVVYSERRTQSFKNSSMPSSQDVEKLLSEFKLKVDKFTVSGPAVHFVSGGTTVACPTNFVVCVVCSVLFENKLNVFITRKKSMRRTTPIVVFADGKRPVGFLAGWLV